MSDILAFHFLRPWWFLGVIPVGILLASIWQSRIHMGRWENVCDPELLEALSLNQVSNETRTWWYGLALLWSLAILALAGPTWTQLEVPIYKSEDAVVITLDLSKSMDAEDIKPSRLERTKLKVLRLLKERDEGLFGLVVFSDYAFVTSPLTEDKKTISNYVPALTPDLMPSQGSRPDRAILAAIELLQQAQVRTGNIFLFCDGVADPDAANEAAKRARRAGYRVFVLAIGSPRGGPIPQRQGGFIQNAQGELVIAKPNFNALQNIARHGGGKYQLIKQSDNDILQILEQFDISSLDTESEKEYSAEWRDAGYWLILPLLLALAMSFRRGWLSCTGLWLPWLVLPGLLVNEPSHADMGSLWQNRDQQAFKEFSQGNYDASSALFDNSEWKAASLYRQKKYSEAAKVLENINTVGALYNKGNALAQLGHYEDAIRAYEQALSLNPEHENAQVNKNLLETLLNSPPPQGEQSPDNQDRQPDSNEQSGSDKKHNDAQNVESNSQNNAASPNTQKQSPTNIGETQEASNSELNSHRNLEHAEDTRTPDQNINSQMDDYQPMNETASEAEQALQQWLRQVPDDPGGLLRRKFAMEQQKKRYRSSNQEEPW
ncbi:MAG TPA: hypothetical protein DCZ03_11335 [Gammaproteobacteria bacterium]|nr:hypothetical protein [Gammaproteobacteria bacterium]